MHLIRYYEENLGYRTALLTKEGNSLAHVVVIDHPVRLVKLPIDECGRLWDYLPCTNVEKARQQHLDAGRRLGITDGALNALQNAA